MSPTTRAVVPASNPPAKGAGFTLIELVVTIAIVAIALLGVAYSLQFSLRQSADPLWHTKSVELVHAYADEILARRFDELSPVHERALCGPCTEAENFGSEGETRDASGNGFDDVDDYHGLSEQPRDAYGNPRPGYEGYRVAISVAYAGRSLGLDHDQQVKSVTIRIYPPGHEPLDFAFYRGSF